MLERETELKLKLVDPTQLPQLLAALPEPWEVVEQANHYFVDPERRLDARRVAVRARQETTRAGATRTELTIKRRTGKVDGVFHAEEHNTPLDAASLDAVRRGERDLAELALDMTTVGASLGVEHLELRGTLANRRHRIRLGGFELEVDQTRFPDGSVDAEIEVETDRPEAARQLLAELAAESGVELANETRGKYARFLRRTGAR